MLFEMPLVPQLVEKFPAFYAISGFITLVITTHQQALIANHYFVPHHQHATFYTPLILLDMITHIKYIYTHICRTRARVRVFFLLLATFSITE